MARVDLDIDRTALHGVGMRAARTLVTRVTRRTFNRSQVLTPVDTGRLRASGRMLPATPRGSVMVGGVEYDANYAAAVHNGRRALTIRARSGRALRFTVGGRVVFARAVRQPARVGRPFLRQALQEEAGAAGFRVVSIG